jgi:hypothetical protein
MSNIIPPYPPLIPLPFPLSPSSSLARSLSLSPFALSLPLSPFPSLHLSPYPREAYRNGTLTTEGVRRVLKLEPNKMGKIADFFVREISEAVPRAPLVAQEKEREREKNNAGVTGKAQCIV